MCHLSGSAEFYTQLNTEDFASANMRQSIFAHMAQNMLSCCCQSVTRCLLHQTVKVKRAYATRPAKQQQMVNILDPRAIVMDTSKARLNDSCFSVRVQLLCSQPWIEEITQRANWQEVWQKMLNHRCDVMNTNL